MKQPLLYLLIIALLLSGCQASVLIVRSDHLHEEAKALKNVPLLVLEPEVQKVIVKERSFTDYSHSQAAKKQFNHYLKQAARKNRFKLEVKDLQELSGNDLARYQLLAEFRDHVQESAFQQQPLQARSGSLHSGLKESVMPVTPRLFPEYASLSARTGTPYLALTGWTDVDASDKARGAQVEEHYSQSGRYTYFYLIVVNTETAEVLYREVKHLSYPGNRQTMFTALYDSFYLFRKHLGS